MNPAANETEPQAAATASTDDAQFSKIAEQQQKETAPAPVNFLESALDESERRLRDHLVTQAEDFKHKQRLANLFARSGCFADIKGQTAEQSIAQAFVKIELGEAMGFSAAESMQGVNLINGTPSVSAQLRAARMQRAGYSWQIDWFEDANGVCTGCRLWLYREGKPVTKPKRDPEGNAVRDEAARPVMEQVSVAFLRKDAAMLMTKIWERDGNNRTSRTASVLEKDNWKNTPRNMYFARAVTNLQRWYAPGVLSGDVPSTEEVLDGPVTGVDNALVTPDPAAETAEQMRARKVEEAQAWHRERGKKMPEFKSVPNPDEAPPEEPGPQRIDEKQGQELLSFAAGRKMPQPEMKKILERHGFHTPGAITEDKLPEIVREIEAWEAPAKQPLFGGKK
jgi:hypothetical protein